MRHIVLLSAALCWLTGSSFIQAEQSPTVDSASAHPFFVNSLYPAWSTLTPAQGATDVRAAINLAKERQAAIRAIKPEEATYENVFAAFEHMTYELDRSEGLLSHLSAVLDNEDIRAVQESLIPELSDFASSVPADAQLWQVIKTASEQPWVKELSPAKQRYVQQVVDFFKDSGADLNDEQKARLAQIHRELSELTHKFSKNVLDSTNAWEWVVDDADQLKGLSEAWMNRAAEAAVQSGYATPENPKWLVTLDDTSARDVLFYCEVENSRKICWEALNTIGKTEPWDNEPVVARVMELRREMAELLGFRNFADLQLARRMAGSGDRAMAFVDDMMQKVKPAFDAEVAELRSYISQNKGEQIEALDPWDTPYYLRKLSRERYNFDPETLRPYQEFSHVRRGMFSIFQHLYNITIKELPTCYLEPGTPHPQDGSVEVWHPDVKAFAVYDNKTGAHLGSFYMDLFPRSSKRSGAWVMPLHFGTPSHDGKPHSPHLAVLCGNLSPATADTPALFSHYEVETLFHEFGHMMHALLSDTELCSQAGTSVAWDFVELPSQMNEDWTWEPLGIATYAVHYETGEHIPDEIIEKMQKSRFFFPAHENMGQLCIAKLDMEMHIHYDEKFKDRDLDAATQELLAPWRAPLSTQSSSIMRNLTHCISGGYAAGYYSYKWAEVLAADVFTRFRKDGVLNAKTGAEYREKILSKGDSKPAAELYRDFMGRDPNPDALLQKQGLLK